MVRVPNGKKWARRGFARSNLKVYVGAMRARDRESM